MASRSASMNPTPGYADPMATTYAYAEQARNRGAEILTGCAVTGINISGGRVTGVDTEQGPIDADAVVAAIGPWINKFTAPIGEFLPVTPHSCADGTPAPPAVHGVAGRQRH